MEIFGMEISEKIYLPIIILLVGIAIYLVISIVINKKISISKKASKHEQRSRATVLLMIKNIIKIVFTIIIILSILQVLGVNTSAIVASVGAMTVVIGLAFQDVLKDYLVGAAIILETQYAIGEIVSINGFKGEVVSLTLRSTRLKALTGETKIIANRNISEVINYSLSDVLLKVIVSTSYESDLNKVDKVLKDLTKRLNTEIEELKSEITIEGVDSLSSSSVDYLLTVYTSARNQFVVKRKILKEVKLAFDKNNIKIPYPQVEVHNEK